MLCLRSATHTVGEVGNDLDANLKTPRRGGAVNGVAPATHFINTASPIFDSPISV